MRRRGKAFLQSVIIGMVALAAGAQPKLATYTISGSIDSPAGHGIPGVMVYLDGTYRSYAATDSRGSFVFPNLPPGRYTVRVQTVEGIDFPNSPRTFSSLQSSQTISFTARPSRALRVQWEKLAQLYETASDGAELKRGAKAIGAIRAPSGLLSAWLAVTMNDPNLAMPPGMEVTYHCASSNGIAIFVGGRNVAGDRSVKLSDTVSGGGCSR